MELKIKPREKYVIKSHQSKNIYTDVPNEWCDENNNLIWPYNILCSIFADVYVKHYDEPYSRCKTDGYKLYEWGHDIIDKIANDEYCDLIICEYLYCRFIGMNARPDMRYRNMNILIDYYKYGIRGENLVNKYLITYQTIRNTIIKITKSLRVRYNNTEDHAYRLYRRCRYNAYSKLYACNEAIIEGINV